MIDEIQGPPRWDGPDVLLRQTSFRALAEPRRFRAADGSRQHRRTAGAVRRGRGPRHRAHPARARALRRLAAEVDRRLAAGTRAGSRRRRARRLGGGPASTERGLVADDLGVLHLPGRRRPPRRRRPPPDTGRRPARRRLDPRGADRLRGLPAPLGGRHLPVEPDRGDGSRDDRPAGAALDSAGWPASSSATSPIPIVLYDRLRGRVARARRAAISGRTARDQQRRQDRQMSTVTTPMTHRRPPATSGRRAARRSTAVASTSDADPPAARPWTPAPRSPARTCSTVPVADAAGRRGGRRRRAHEAFLAWRTVPAPVRGALVKRLGELLTEHKDDLADLVTIEVGKIRSEALGEVQEMIDICDFAVGLSRQLDGRTMPSERPGHRLMETWHPLGVVARDLGVQLPGRGLGVEHRARPGLRRHGGLEAVGADRRSTAAGLLGAAGPRAAERGVRPAHLNVLVVGGRRRRGRAGRQPAGARWSARPARSGWARRSRRGSPPASAAAILELGGNNAAVVTPSADLDLAVRGIVFAAAGTAGQRCTTMRRLIVHEAVADELVERIGERLPAVCRSVTRSPTATLVGPLIDEAAFDADAAGARARPSPTAARSSPAASAATGGRPRRVLRPAGAGPDAGPDRRRAARRRSRRSSTC